MNFSCFLIEMLIHRRQIEVSNSDITVNKNHNFESKRFTLYKFKQINLDVQLTIIFIITFKLFAITNLIIINSASLERIIYLRNFRIVILTTNSSSRPRSRSNDDIYEPRFTRILIFLENGAIKGRGRNKILGRTTRFISTLRERQCSANTL